MVQVSVVIPAYNPGVFLHRSIDSVLSQMMDDLECVVVDDGSSENLRWVAEHPDGRVRYLRQQNFGVSVARNVGVREARAPWIAFLDQDDEWLPHKLGRQLELLAQESGSPFCYTGFHWVHADRVEPAARQRVTYRGLLSNQHVCLSTVVVARSAYLAVGGHDPLLRVMQDYDLFLRLSRFGPPVGVDEALVRYHLHDANVSGDYRTAARERFGLIRSHRDAALRGGDERTVAACDMGIRRTRELYGQQALAAARAAHHQSDVRGTMTHLLAAGHLTHGRVVNALTPAIAARIKAFGRQESFGAAR